MDRDDDDDTASLPLVTESALVRRSSAAAAAGCRPQGNEPQAQLPDCIGPFVLSPLPDARPLVPGSVSSQDQSRYPSQLGPFLLRPLTARSASSPQSCKPRAHPRPRPRSLVLFSFPTTSSCFFHLPSSPPPSALHHSLAFSYFTLSAASWYVNILNSYR